MSIINKRIEWIDRAKGIGIILVILGHSIIPNNLKVWLYSFHMPLFFFLSSCVYKKDNEISLKNFILKKAKTLIVPALIFNIIYILCSVVIKYINFSKTNINIFRNMIGVFIQVRGGEFSFGAWFLICLFSAEILLYIIMKKIFSDKYLMIIAFLSSILGYLYSKFIGIITPWSLEAALTAIAFLILGYLFKKHQRKIDKYMKIKYLILYFVINVITCFINYKLSGMSVDIYANKYGIYIFYFIAAISGILMTIIFVKEIVHFNELQYIGKNSLIYYCMHVSIIEALNIFINVKDINTNVDKLEIGIVYLIINCLILHLVSSFINKRCSFILGKF